MNDELLGCIYGILIVILFLMCYLLGREIGKDL